VKDAKVDPPPRNSCKTGSLIALGSVLLLFGIFFYKSVLLGKPLAKLGTLPLIDSLYNPALKQAIIDIGRDPSGYLIFFPNGHFEDSMWWRLVPPLWNPLVACGYPQFGDPQSFLYSPAHLLRLFSTPDLYNVGLLLEIAMGGIGMVLLARYCRLSIIASIFASAAFVLSPRILAQVDIGNNECLFPWLFLGFFWLAERPSFTRAALLGVLCAFVSFAAHPETCFLAILIAAAFTFFSLTLRNVLQPDAGQENLSSSSFGSVPSQSGALSGSQSESSSSAQSESSSSAQSEPSSSLQSESSSSLQSESASSAQSESSSSLQSESSSSAQSESSNSSQSGSSSSAQNLLLTLVVNAGKAFLLLLTTAIVSLLVASPMVFPFLEFMRNAYIYKDVGGTAVPLVWSDFVNGLLADHGPEPFFIGSVALILAPLGLFARKQLAIPLLCAFVFGALICLPQGFILHFLSQKPMSYVATMYGIPDLLLILALLAGLGLDLFLKRFTWPRVATVVLSAALVCYYPIYFLQETNNQERLKVLWHTFNNLLNATTVIGAVAFALTIISFILNKAAKLSPSSVAPISSRHDLSITDSPQLSIRSIQGDQNQKLPPIISTVITIAFLALNFSSLAILDRNVLPNNPKFTLKPPAPIAFLEEHPARSTAVGTNLFLPNTNLDYGIEDFRCFSPLLPLRYKQYLQEAGGRCYNLYFYVLPERCSKLLDIASIKYVLTRSAVRGEETLETMTQEAQATTSVDSHYVDLGEPKCKRLIPGLRILTSILRYDKQNSQVDADMVLRVHASCNYHYAVQYCVFGGDGKEVWSSRELVISPADGEQHTSKTFQSWPIPRSAKFPVSIGLRLKDTWISQIVPPPSDVPHAADAFLISTLDANSAALLLPATHNNGGGTAFPSPARHYSLLKEFPEEGCRIYENNKGLAASYLVTKARHFRTGDSQGVLRALQESDFDPSSSVIVEDDSNEGGPSEVGSARYMNARAKNAAASGKKGAASDKSGATSDKSGAASEKSGVASEKNGTASDKSGTASEKSGTASDKNGAASGKNGAGASRALSLTRQDCNTVVIDGTADGDSWLVLTDAYYPGWKCYVDGNETKIYPANFLFRAVRLSKGHHIVKFVFAPFTFYGPLLLSVATLLLIATLGYLRRKELFATEGSIITCNE
jgi:hypothetical protein